MFIFLFLVSFSPLSDSLFDYLSNINCFTAEYEETILDTLTETSYTFRGKIYLKRPYFFKMEVNYPEEQYLICNGEVLWLYIPSDSTEYIIPLDDPSADIPRPDMFIFGSQENYIEIDVIRSDYSAVLSFKPREENSFFSRVDISVAIPNFTIEYLRIFSNEYGERLMIFTDGTQNYSNHSDNIYFFENN